MNFILVCSGQVLDQLCAGFSGLFLVLLRILVHQVYISAMYSGVFSITIHCKLLHLGSSSGDMETRCCHKGCTSQICPCLREDRCGLKKTELKSPCGGSFRENIASWIAITEIFSCVMKAQRSSSLPLIDRTFRDTHLKGGRVGLTRFFRWGRGCSFLTSVTGSKEES